MFSGMVPHFLFVHQVLGKLDRRTSDDLCGEIGALLALQGAGDDVAVFGKAGSKCTGAGGAL